MKYYLDSSFLLNLLIEDHVFHKKALEFLEKNKGEYYISTLTLIEVIYNLQKLRYDLSNFLDLIKEFTIIDFSFEDILKTIEIKELNIFDALHYVLAKKIDAKLVTFDKDFEGLENVIII